MAVSDSTPDLVQRLAGLTDPDQGARLLGQARDLLLQLGPRALAALLILILGRWLARRLRRLVGQAMERAGVDPLIVGFTRSLVYIGLLVFVVLAALGQLGVQTTSFLAVLGAAGLAVGLALKDSLANFAAGVLLILLRPFKVGDLIQAAGITGKVDQIRIFDTVLRTPDNKTVIVPNARLRDDCIVNYSAQATRRVELSVGVSYDADLRHVRQVLEAIVAHEGRILPEPAPRVAVAELGDSAVKMQVRVWVAQTDVGAVRSALNEAIKNRFDDEGIVIPYPTLEVRLRPESGTDSGNG